MSQNERRTSFLALHFPMMPTRTVWLTDLFDLTFWFFRYITVASIIIPFIYTLVLAAVLMRVELNTRKLQQRLTDSTDKSVYIDDDDKWIFGMFYYNPNDTHIMVNKRTGIGTTINLAKPVGIFLTALLIVVLFGIPFLGIFMINAELTPVQLEISDDRVIALHTREVYSVNIDDIESLKMIDDLPDGRRTNGTALKTVLKGNFRYDGIGPCRLCLNPETPPFIIVDYTRDDALMFWLGQYRTVRKVIEDAENNDIHKK